MNVVNGTIRFHQKDGSLDADMLLATFFSPLSPLSGLKNVDNGGTLFIPPDSHAAAGMNHIVNVVNVTIRFHQKDGSLDA